MRRPAPRHLESTIPENGSSPGPDPWRVTVDAVLPEDHPLLSSEVLVLTPEPRNVRVARQWVRPRIPSWARDLEDTIVLLTSELVTNVVVHARTELRLGIAVTDRDVVVGVHDLDLGRREVERADRDGGRGLELLAQLTPTWGRQTHEGGGKTYWFRMSA